MVVGDIATGTEVIVIGAGPGGYTAAIKAAQEGKEVLLVDKEQIGGICLNHGCIPAKSIIHASKFHYDLKHWEEIGIKTENIEVDFEEIQNWKSQVVNKLNNGIKTILKKEGVEFKKGEAHFIDSSTVRIEEEHNTEKINFEKAIIATGSKPVEIPGLEFNKEGVISSRELLQLEEVPEKIIVVGGGYIGMEAVTKFTKFGSEVEIVEAEERVLRNFDKDLVDNLKEVNPEYGSKIHTSTKAKRVEYNDEKPVLITEDKKGNENRIEGDYILVAAGRKAEPLLKNLKLDNTSVNTENGFVKVDKQMRTTDDNIYAIGDCAGNPLLAHKAYREGKVAAKAIAGKPVAFDNQYIPKVMYTDPEIAVVGTSLEEAKEKYENLLIGRFPFSASGRALTTNKNEGFVRVIATEKEKLVGVQIIGSRASDMISEATLALEMQAYLDDIINTIHAHPTFSEALAEACEAAKNESIHI